MGIAPSAPTEETVDLFSVEMLGEAYSHVKTVAENLPAIIAAGIAFQGDEGFGVIKHKKAGLTTYARTAAQWLAVGGLDDANVFHYIDPALDADLIAGTNTVDLCPMLVNAIDALHPVNGGQLMFPAGFTFLIKDQLIVDKPKVVFAMHGATIDADYSGWLPEEYRPVLGILGDDCALLGGTIQESGDHPNSWQLEVQGKRLTIEDTFLTKPNRSIGGSSYQAYFRYGSDGVHARGLRTSLADGIYIESSNNSWIGCTIECEVSGGDDAFVIKAIQGVTENNKFIGCQVTNAAAILSIGSEVGVHDPARDAAHSRQARNIVLEACTGTNCTSLLLAKPGAVASVPYGDGWIHTVKLNNNTLIDMTGAKMGLPISMVASRGCWISNVSGDNNRIIGRVVGTEATGHKRAIDIWTLEYDAGWQPKIWDVDLGFEYHDPYDGVELGVGGAPGYPLEMIGSVVDDTAAGNAITNIKLRIKGNGCRGTGFFVSDGLDNVVTLEKIELTNTCVAGVFGTGSLQIGSIVKIDKHSLSPNTVTTFATGAVKYINLATAIVSTGSVLYRKTAGDGLYENQSLATLKTDLGLTGVNSGDQVSIVGISGTLAQFNTAITDANIPQASTDLTDSVSIYRIGSGPVVALEDGGTGAELFDPGADRLFFWDDSAATSRWLQLGAGLTITDDVLSASGLSLADGDYTDVLASGAGAALTVQGATGAFVVGGHCQLNDSFRVSGTLTTPSSGSGIEMVFSSTLGRISCLERGGSGIWWGLEIRALYHDMKCNGTSVGVFSATGLAMVQPVTVPANAYGVAWNGSLKAATEDAVYDKMEAVVASIDALAFQTLASSAAVTPTFTNDVVDITAQATGLTLNDWTGTPTDMWGLVVRLKDNGTARTIAYSSNYVAASGVTLPVNTVVGKTHELAFEYNHAMGKFICLSAVSY